MVIQTQLLKYKITTESLRVLYISQSSILATLRLRVKGAMSQYQLSF